MNKYLQIFTPLCVRFNILIGFYKALHGLGGMESNNNNNNNNNVVADKVTPTKNNKKKKKNVKTEVASNPQKLPESEHALKSIEITHDKSLDNDDSNQHLMPDGRTKLAVKRNLKKWNDFAKKEKTSLEKYMIKKFSMLDGRKFQLQMRDDDVLVASYGKGTIAEIKLAKGTTLEQALNDLEVFSSIRAYVDKIKSQSEWHKVTEKFNKAGMKIRLLENNGVFEAKVSNKVFYSNNDWETFIKHMVDMVIDDTVKKKLKDTIELKRGKRISKLLTLGGKDPLSNWAFEKVDGVYRFVSVPISVPVYSPSYFYRKELMKSDFVTSQKKFVATLEDDSYFKSIANAIKPGTYVDKKEMPGLKVFDLGGPQLPDKVDSLMKQAAENDPKALILSIITRFPKQSKASSFVQRIHGKDEFVGKITIDGKVIHEQFISDGSKEDAIRFFYKTVMAKKINEKLLDLLIEQNVIYGSAKIDENTGRVVKVHRTHRPPSTTPRTKSDRIAQVIALKKICSTTKDFYEKSRKYFDPDNKLKPGVLKIEGHDYKTYDVAYFSYMQRLEMRSRGIDPCGQVVNFYDNTLSNQARHLKSQIPTIESLARSFRPPVYYNIVAAKTSVPNIWRASLHIKLGNFMSPNWNGEKGGRYVRASSEKAAQFGFIKSFYPFDVYGNTTPEFDAIMKAMASASDRVAQRLLKSRQKGGYNRDLRTGHLDQDELEERRVRGENGKRMSDEQHAEIQAEFDKKADDRRAREYEDRLNSWAEDNDEMDYSVDPVVFMNGQEYYRDRQLLPGQRPGRGNNSRQQTTNNVNNNNNINDDYDDYDYRDDYGFNPHQDY